MRDDLIHLSGAPLPLSFTRARRTYTGGKLLEELHGYAGPRDSFYPEEWVGSVVQVRGTGGEDEGLSDILLEGGSSMLLKDLIHLAPELFLGPGHVRRYGDNPAMLVKLIDSAERLSVQVHPDRAFSRAAFGSEFGKTESWYVLGTRKISGLDPYLLIGFKPWVTRDLWEDLIESQDIPAMLDCLHRVSPAPGDVYMIGGGLPHAIGPGCFLIEIQEPTDYTLRAEMTSPHGDPFPELLIHQGIGRERLLDCFHYDTGTLEETIARCRVAPAVTDRQPGGTRRDLTGPGASEFFSMAGIEVTGQFICDAATTYSLLIVLSGTGTISWSGGSRRVNASSRLFLPFGMHGCTLTNACGPDAPLRAVLCYPPA